jgi:hypothetical protein
MRAHTRTRTRTHVFVHALDMVLALTHARIDAGAERRGPPPLRRDAQPARRVSAAPGRAPAPPAPLCQKLGDSPANLLINQGVVATLQERRLGYHSRVGLEPGTSGFSTLRINHYAARAISSARLRLSEWPPSAPCRRRFRVRPAGTERTLAYMNSASKADGLLRLAPARGPVTHRQHGPVYKHAGEIVDVHTRGSGPCRSAQECVHHRAAEMTG